VRAYKCRLAGTGKGFNEEKTGFKSFHSRSNRKIETKRGIALAVHATIRKRGESGTAL